MKNKLTVEEQYDLLRFGQQHIHTQDFFGERYWDVPLVDFPHYKLLATKFDLSLDYIDYLKHSWEYYQPELNTHTDRMNRRYKFLQLFYSVRESGGLNNPIQVWERPSDGKLVVIDGNHRAAIAATLRIDLPIEIQSATDALANLAPNPYHNVVDKGGNDIVSSVRRNDTFDRFKFIDKADVMGESVLDLGCNIGANSLLAGSLGAKVTAVDLDKSLLTSGIRLNNYFQVPVRFAHADLNNPLPLNDNKKFDTVFCFSVWGHIKDIHTFSHEILKRTRDVLYFEGHAGSRLGDYSALLNDRNFSSIALIGESNANATTEFPKRPLFRCLVR